MLAAVAAAAAHSQQQLCGLGASQHCCCRVHTMSRPWWRWWSIQTAQQSSTQEVLAACSCNMEGLCCFLPLLGLLGCHGGQEAGPEHLHREQTQESVMTGISDDQLEARWVDRRRECKARTGLAGNRGSAVSVHHESRHTCMLNPLGAEVAQNRSCCSRGHPHVSPTPPGCDHHPRHPHLTPPRSATHIDHVDVQDALLRWNKRKVDVVGSRPQPPVG